MNECRVKFVSPWSTRLFGFFVTGLVVGLMGALAAIVMWAGVPYLFWPVTSPIPGWWSIVAAPGTLVVILVVAYGVACWYPSRLILDEESIRIGSLAFHRRFAYDRLTSIDCESSESPNGVAQLFFRAGRGGRLSIFLKERDAQACYAAIAAACPQAVPMVEGTAFVAPDDPAHIRETAADEMRRKAAVATVAAIATALFTLLGGAAIIIGFGRSNPRAWAYAAIGPISIAGFLIARAKYRADARKFLSPDNEEDRTSDG